MLVLIDSGVLIRLLEASDPHHRSIRDAVRMLRGRGDTLVMAAQNAAEFRNVCTRPTSARGGLGLPTGEADRRLRILERLFPVVPEVAAVYSIWRDLIVAHGVRGVQAHDARLVALMRAHRIAHLLTLNGGDFARYPGIVAFGPASLPASPPPPP